MSIIADLHLRGAKARKGGVVGHRVFGEGASSSARMLPGSGKRRLLWEVEYRLDFASESDRPTWGSRARTAHLGHFDAGLTAAGPSGVVAGVLSFCASCTSHSEWRAFRHKSEVATWRRNAIANGLQPW